MKNTLITIIIAAIVSFAVVKLTPTENTGTASQEESVYDRVMRTKTIRCGYALWPALIEQDPNTGELYGTFVDYLEELGGQLGMTVEWSEELGFGNFVEALNSNRIDALCSGAWTNSARGSVVDFIIPISYQGVVAYARPDDRRFDNNLPAINSPNVKVVGLEGGTTGEIPQQFFPEASLTLLPQMTDVASVLMHVTTKKADVVFVDRYTASQFLEKNQDALREIPAQYPPRLFGNPISIKKGEYQLKQTLDNATLQLIHTGVIERILQKHEKYPGTFYRPAPMFQN